MRDNILESLKCIGFVNKKINEKLDEIKIEEVSEELEVLKQDKGEENQFRNFLEEEMTAGDFNWLSNARRAFKSSLNIFDVRI